MADERRGEVDRGKYQSPVGAGMRFVTQELMLKPLVWRLINIEVHGKQHLERLEAPFVRSPTTRRISTPHHHRRHAAAAVQVLATGAAPTTFFDTWYRACPPGVHQRLPHRAQGTAVPQGHVRAVAAGRRPAADLPEGTRSRTGAMGRSLPASRRASRATCGAAHRARGRSSPPGPTVRRTCPGPSTVHIVFGPPLQPAPGEIAHQFNDRMRRTVQQLHDSTAGRTGCPPGRLRSCRDVAAGIGRLGDVTGERTGRAGPEAE
jgi:1-acyl-sn-glycerol-3-phosphate acyltransferase